MRGGEMPDPGDPEEKSETMEKLEEDPPKDLKDWPDDENKYQTFGGPEGHHGYEEGPEAKLALERLAERLARALAVPKTRRPTKATRASRERRLEAKRHLSQRKRERRRPDD